MKNEFTPYDVALALKELGFDEDVCGYFSKKKKLYIVSYEYNDVIKLLKAPTYSQAFRWFREEYKLFGEVCLTTKQEDVESFEFGVLNVNEPLFESDDYTVYEQAELACLKKLIEIVNQNKEDEYKKR